MEKPAHSVTVSRVVDASPDTLYAAWTDQAGMERWMGKVTQADARVGGGYRIEHQAGDGQVYVHKGQYRVLEPGRRIVQSFAAGPAGREPLEAGAPQNGEFVEVSFRAVEGGGTEVTLTNGWQEGAALDADGMEAVEQAWAHWLALMDGHVGGSRQTSSS
jgi:uncharacterized protein YndB with AHSA1/START domain